MIPIYPVTRDSARRVHWLLVAVAAATAAAATVTRETRIPDADTRAWWKITGDLAADTMEGRDTGSAGHARAVAYVEARFKAAGLEPAGDADGYTQTLPLHEVRVETLGTTFSVTHAAGSAARLRFLHDISVRPSDTLPAALDGGLAFRGYCSSAELRSDIAGKIVVCFGSRRHGLPGAGERLAAAAAAGAAGLVAVDDPGFTLEPARWPEAYARSVTLARIAAPTAGPAGAASPVVLRASSAALAVLIRGSGRNAADILAAGAASRPLPSFDVPARLRAALAISRRDYTSDNVLGLLPGTDPALGHEVLVLSAHLDGYGIGEPVNGDAIYNGALDDAAYVATLLRLAEQRHGRGFKRSVLFAAFTGEEKGLLGATWFTSHPTVARADLAADINLDQLRPLFPLTILTMHAVDDTTLGTAARAVAGPRHIAIRPDLEPERNLNQRADHWPFLQIGVPATGFVFGYDAGTAAERRYRDWYQVRYHRPQDDSTQPLDFQAAADFNGFFYALAAAVADAAERPAFIR